MVVVKVGGEGQGSVMGSRSGEGSWLWSRSGVKVRGQSWGQGQGHDRWSQGRSRSVVKVRV